MAYLKFTRGVVFLYETHYLMMQVSRITGEIVNKYRLLVAVCYKSLFKYIIKDNSFIYFT